MKRTPIAEMMSPVRCTCGSVYDLAAVEVTGRYVDCSVWRAPCCGREADDRGETGWKTIKDYTPLSREDVERGYRMCMDGSMMYYEVIGL